MTVATMALSPWHDRPVLQRKVTETIFENPAEDCFDDISPSQTNPTTSPNSNTILAPEEHDALFSTVAYEQEVLQLPDGQTESDLERAILAEARKLSIDLHKLEHYAFITSTSDLKLTTGMTDSNPSGLFVGAVNPNRFSSSTTASSTAASSVNASSSYTLSMSSGQSFATSLASNPCGQALSNSSPLKDSARPSTSVDLGDAQGTDKRLSFADSACWLPRRSRSIASLKPRSSISSSHSSILRKSSSIGRIIKAKLSNLKLRNSSSHSTFSTVSLQSANTVSLSTDRIRCKEHQDSQQANWAESIWSQHCQDCLAQFDPYHTRDKDRRQAATGEDVFVPGEALCTLQCSHLICRYHLRERVRQSQRPDSSRSHDDGGQNSRCTCGHGIPVTELDGVIDVYGWEKLEQFLRHLSSSSDRVSLAPEDHTKTANQAHPASHRPSLVVSFYEEPVAGGEPVDPGNDARYNLEKAQTVPGFQEMYARHIAQRDLFQAYMKVTLNKFVDTRDAKRQKLAKSQSEHYDELENRVFDALRELEDRHIFAESDLDSVHVHEAFSADLKLRHMENYYKDTLSGMSEREMTNTKMFELEKQRYVQRNIGARHQSAIRILRALQESEYKKEQQKTNTELASMRQRHRHARADFEESARCDYEALVGFISERRERLLRRWSNETEIWRVQQAGDVQALVRYPLLQPQFPPVVAL